MAQDKETFLGRWSRVKREQAEKPVAEKKDLPQEKPPELPPIDKLTPDSEFSGFMHPKVDDALRRAALKKMFTDPHFNTPDPFEPFSGDWTVADPIPDELMAKLNQVRTVLFPDRDKDKKQEAEQQAAQQPPAGEQAKAQAKEDDEPGRQDA